MFADGSARAESRRAARRRSSRGFCLTAAIAVWVITGVGLARATAASITVDLAFEVEPEARGCPDAEAFRTSVRRQLGYDPFASGAERTVVVSIAHRSNGFNGRIHWNDSSGHWAGERRLSSHKADCTSLAQDLAFSVAVQVQLLATLAPVEPKAPAGPSAPVISTVVSPRKDGPASPAAASPVSPSPLPPAQPAASGPSESRPSAPSPRDEAGPARPADDEARAPSANISSPASRTQASDSTGVSLWVGLGPAFAWALAPRNTPVGRLFVDVRGAWISAEVAVDAAWPVTHQVARTGGFKLERTSAMAAVCGHASVFLGCVLATVGILRAGGVGLDAPGSPTGGFYQLGARLGARFPLASRYFAGVRMDGLWSPAPWTVEANGVPMWTTPRLGALVGVDVGAIFF